MDAKSIRKKWSFIVYILLLLPGLAKAGHDYNVDLSYREGFTADNLVGLVLDRNPGIASLAAIEEAAKYQIEPARSLDDLMFSYGFAPKTLDADNGRGLNQKFEFSQKIPWPGTLAVREEVALREAKVAHEDVNALRLRLAALTKSAYAEWYFVDRAIEIHGSTSELLEELRAVAEARYAAGLTLQQDVLQAEVEQRNLDRYGLELNRLKSSIQARINALLNQKPSSPIPPAADISIRKPILPLEVLEHRAMNMHPELKRLDAKMAANTAQVTLAEKDFYPELRFTAGYNSLWDDHDKRPIVGVSINVPLDQSKRKASLNRAKANERSMQLKLVNQRTQLLGELARTHAEVLESAKAIELYENSLVPLANEYLSSTIADYQSGAGSFLSVITAEQKKLVFEEGLERNRANYFSRVAELERWAGTSFDEQLAFSKGAKYEN
jgi:outer membrane protein TolC